MSSARWRSFFRGEELIDDKTGERLLPNHGQVHWFMYTSPGFNTLRPRRNRHLFADDIFKYIFLNDNVLISIKIPLKFIPKGPIDNIPALVQIMAWRRQGAQSLSETMMVRLLTNICVTRSQCVKGLSFSIYYVLSSKSENIFKMLAVRVLRIETSEFFIWFKFMDGYWVWRLYIAPHHCKPIKPLWRI